MENPIIDKQAVVTPYNPSQDVMVNPVQSNQSRVGSVDDDFAKSITPTLVDGQSITDLINQAQAYQASAQNTINSMQSKLGGNGVHGSFSFDKGFQDFASSLEKPHASLAAQAGSMGLGDGRDYGRYSQSGDFQTFGYTPGVGAEQEYKYGRAMTWGDTLGKALAGGGSLAADTFMEGWKGWGRMADALFTWDSSKLMGSESERYEMAKKQEDIFNKYAIYDNETSKDSIWNRQFFGSMLQQTGFAVGAGAQWALESYLTAGLGKLVSGAGKAVEFAEIAEKAGVAAERSTLIGRGVEKVKSVFSGVPGVKASELINDVRKASDVIINTENNTNLIANVSRNLIPLYGTAEDMIKLHKAGAGMLQLGMTGVGGVHRALSEFNMARSESIYEAASTYANLKDKLVQEYITTHNQYPSGDELERISQTAENASHDNFWTNVGVISVMNRLQFGNMFDSFKKSRTVFSEGVHELEDRAFSVTGKIEGKTATRAFETGTFGKLGAIPEIANVFGKKTAAWEAMKAIPGSMLKFEGSEGAQELIQNATNEGLSDYYYQLYHGKEGYTGRLDAMLSNMQNPLTDMEGMKTFLMGAFTGAIIAPFSHGISKINENIYDSRQKAKNADYQSTQDRAKEAVATMNAFYENMGNDPSHFKREWIANTKIQNKAADTMEQAAKNHDQYTYQNAKDSAFSKAVASAIKLNMFDSLRDVIKEYGANMDDKQFKEAFGMDATETNKKSAANYMNHIASSVEDYHKVFFALRDKYGDRVIPELYKNNGEEAYNRANLSKAILDDAIEMLATNVYKSRQVVKRVAALQGEIGSHETIGGSSMEVLTKMGSAQALDDHINNLQRELDAAEKTNSADMTDDQKKLLKQKAKELKLSKEWGEAFLDIVQHDNESDFTPVQKRAYSAFEKLLNHYNEVAKITTTVSKMDVDDAFTKFFDYIRLNMDHKSYVDALNVLSKPQNMTIMANAMQSGVLDMARRFKEQHAEEVKKATSTQPIAEAEVVQSTTNTPTAATTTEEAPKEAAPVPTGNISDFEDFMKEQYSTAETDLPYNEWLEKRTAKTQADIYNKRHSTNFKASDLLKKVEVKPEDIKTGLTFTFKGKEYTITDITNVPGEAVSQGATFVTSVAKDGTKIQEDISTVQKNIEQGNYVLGKEEAEAKEATPEAEVKEPIIPFSDIRDTIISNLNEKTRKAYIDYIDAKKSKAFEKFDEANIQTIVKETADILRKLLPSIIGDYAFEKVMTISGNWNITYRKAVERTNINTGEPYTDIVENSFPLDAKEILNKSEEELLAIIQERANKNGIAGELTTLKTEEPLEDESELEDKDRKDYTQKFGDTKVIIDNNDAVADLPFQVGFRQVAPAMSLANTTDLVVDQGNRYERGDVNKKYVFTVATSEFMPGQAVTYKVLTSDFPEKIVNRLTQEEYQAKDFFDAEGNVKPGMYDYAPIGIYSVVNGKEQLIGTVHDPAWIEYKREGGVYPHIVIPTEQLGMARPTVVEEEVNKVNELRKLILDSYNQDKNFVLNGVVESKSNGIIKTKAEAGLLKDRVNPKIAEGGIENRHGMFAIIRNGALEVDKNISNGNVLETEFFKPENLGDKYEGVPVLLIPTPTGKFFPTFVSLPKINTGQAEFIIEAWKAFTKQVNNPEVVNAVYSALGRTKSEGDPDILVLKKYIDQYITKLSAKDKVSRTGTGADAPLGAARLNITKDGKLYLYVNTAEKFHAIKGVETADKLPSNAVELMTNLLTTVKFTDPKTNAPGINSTKKITVLSLENGKLQSSNVNYNQYIMDRSSTFLEKGTESKNKNNDWVYFANPVVKMNYIQPSTEDVTDKAEKAPVDLNDVNNEEAGNSAAFLAALKARKMTDADAEEQKKNCTNLQSKLNNIS